MVVYKEDKQKFLQLKKKFWQHDKDWFVLDKNNLKLCTIEVCYDNKKRFGTSIMGLPIHLYPTGLPIHKKMKIFKFLSKF